MPTVLLVRHAQASFGTAHYDELSGLGRRQTQRLDACLAERVGEPLKLVTGSLRRQIDTAEACLRLRAAGPVASDRRWDEYDSADILACHGAVGQAGVSDIGAPPSLNSAEFQRLLDSALRSWIAAGAASPCAESWPAFRTRTRSGLTELASELGSGETAVVITSGGVIAALVGTCLQAGPDSFIALNRMTVNTAISTILCGPSGLHVLSFGEHAHLYSDRALITFR